MDDSPPVQLSSNSPRRYVRYPADIRVSIQVFRAAGTASVWGRSSELGEDGVGATLTGEIQPGEVVSMELALPIGAAPLKLRAMTRYRSGLRHGFEFLALNAEQRELLRRTCEMLAARL